MIDRPFKIDDFLASMIEALKIKGDSRSIAILLNGECRFEPCDQDWGIDYYNFLIAIPIYIFSAISKDELNLVTSDLLDIGQQFFSSTEKDALKNVYISPKVEVAPEGWRERALAFLKGEGVTNQGRVRSDNIASHQHRGLLFRSKSEIMLFDAMQRKGLAISPLPVFVRQGKSYHRLEPDFLVLYKGITFIVEVDGDTYHRESPADADKRLVPLTHEGIEVRRIRAAELATEVQAAKVVDDLVAFMSSRKASR